MKNIIFILGLPASGKTTLCKNLEKYGFKHLSLGNLLKNNIKYRSTIKDHIQKGEIVPSYITTEILENELSKMSGDILVDSFPRTIGNLDYWNKNVNKNPVCVLLLTCTREVAKLRIEKRFEKEHRVDDEKDCMMKRFDSFDENTSLVLDYFYKKGLLQEIKSSENEFNVMINAKNIINIMKDSNINYDGTLLKFNRLSPNGKCPLRRSKFNAGYDLFSAENKIILPWKNSLIKTDIAIELPFGTYGRIAPRSGLALQQMIDVGGGVVDCGFRGNVQVILFNHNQEPFMVSIGDRIAQLIVTKISSPKLVELELTNSERGEKGFGSSGMN